MKLGNQAIAALLGMGVCTQTVLAKDSIYDFLEKPASRKVAQIFGKKNGSKDPKDVAIVDAAVKAMQAVSAGLKGDPKALTSSTLIQDLAQHPYKDVAEFILSILEEQAESDHANSFIINPFLQTLAKFAGPSQVPELQRLKIAMAQNTSEGITKGIKYVIAEFDNTISSAQRNKDPKPLPDVMSDKDKIAAKAKPMSPLASFLEGTEKFLSDDIKARLQKNKWIKIIERDNETNQALDILIRLKGKVPTFIGLPGVGKTAIMEQIAYLITIGHLPNGLYQNELKNSVLVMTSPEKLSMLAKSNDDNSMAAAVKSYIEGLRAAQEILGKKIILCIDEAHQLSKGQMNALKPVLETLDDPIQVMLATTGKELSFSLAKDEAFMRRIETILIEEFNPAITFKVLQQVWVPYLSKYYNVDIDDVVVKSQR